MWIKSQTRSIDDCYMKLAEAIVSGGVSEYVTAAKKIQKDGWSIGPNRESSIHHYVSGKNFILCGCNGLIGMNGELLLKNVNAKYGLDAEKIEENIKLSKVRAV